MRIVVNRVRLPYMVIVLRWLMIVRAESKMMFSRVEGLMMTNDGDLPNSTANSPEYIAPNAYAEAALVLAESLIHGLCELSSLRTVDAVNIVERAASVQQERANESVPSDPSLWQSYELLIRIANSLKTDLRKEPFDPKMVP